MKIPLQFKLAGIPITVEDVRTFAKEHNCIGQTFYTEQKIVLDMGVAPQEFTEQAFCHEAVHYILYMMGEHELRNNEKFVDLFATFMHQFINQCIPTEEDFDGH